MKDERTDRSKSETIDAGVPPNLTSLVALNQIFSFHPSSYSLAVSWHGHPARDSAIALKPQHLRQPSIP
jgi:hypothetical protein